jgi:DNA topoisomerase VI subunit B
VTALTLDGLTPPANPTPLMKKTTAKRKGAAAGTSALRANQSGTSAHRPGTPATHRRPAKPAPDQNPLLKLAGDEDGAAPRKSRKTTSQAAPARATAETMAARQRDISVSEFFAKNRHLLGFDNPRKALLTTVKEAVDNSLDACEEAGILPDITVVIEDIQPGSGAPALRPQALTDRKPAETRTSPKSSRYRVTVVDNGPGIVRRQVENIFGRLLYGSKFHRLKMSRGQQGIGISAAGMYGLITTGRPMVIHTRPHARKPAHHIELAMNTKTNRAEVTVDIETDDFPPHRLRALGSSALPAESSLHPDPALRPELLHDLHYPTGTSVSIELEGRYQRGRGSVDEFLELTAIANPHARITFIPPTRISSEDLDDEPLLKPARHPAAPPAQAQEPSPQPATTTEIGGITIFPRAVSELPPETQEIKPHPRGIELGILLQFLKEREAQPGGGGSLYSFLQDEFSRVSPGTAAQICKAIGITTRTRVSDVDHALAEKLFRQLQDARLPPPPTNCLAPIGVRQLLAGMLKGVRAEFYAASSREPAVYRGRPFLIEAAIAFGGQLPADDSARVIRFANRVPLLYQQSACSSFKAVLETNWRNYDLQQPRNSLPVGPLVVMIHMASVWVPFTSESKEAIADYDEIRKEMKLALMECGRKLGTYMRKRQKMRREGQRRDVFERYIGEIAKAINAINGADPRLLYEKLLEQARRRTAVADHVLDDEGRTVKGRAADADDDGIIIVQTAQSPPEAPANQELHSRAARVAAQLARAASDSDQDELPGFNDSQPSTTPRRPSASPARPAKSPRAKTAPQSPAPRRRGSTQPAPPAPTPTPAPASASPPANRAPKPKMRLINGKLVPADDPSLF